MTEMEPSEAALDGLLRRSVAAPIPSLPPDFDRRLIGKLHRGSHPFDRYRLDRYRRFLLTGYGLTSVVTSAVVMRGQGLGWVAISVMIAAPLVLLAALFRACRWRSVEPSAAGRSGGSAWCAGETSIE